MVTRRFGVALHERNSLFDAVQPIAPGDALRTHLEVYLPLVLSIQTEKARAELIVAPVLVEAVRLSLGPTSFFSGSEFPADPAEGLTGTLDFVLSRSPEQYFVCAPVLAVVEAKNDDFRRGYGQCLAAMVGAQRFNERETSDLGPIYGAVTTGTNWRFLKLVGPDAWIDRREYYIQDLEQILGILIHMTSSAAALVDLP